RRRTRAAHPVAAGGLAAPAPRAASGHDPLGAGRGAARRRSGRAGGGGRGDRAGRGDRGARLGCGSGTVRTRHLARRTAAPGAGPRGALPCPARGARRAHRPSRRRHRAGGAGPDRRTARGGAHRGGDRAPLRAGGHRRRRGERAARASGGPAMTTASSPALRRAVRALEIARTRLLAAVLAACAPLGSAFALAAVSTDLATRAWTMARVPDLTVAVGAWRALGVSRGTSRWLERVITHDVAVVGVVSLRTNLSTVLASRTDDSLTRLLRGALVY